MANQQGSNQQLRESEFVRWIREERDLPTDVWKQLFSVVVGWLEKRDRHLVRVLRKEVRQFEIHWKLVVKSEGHESKRHAVLENWIRKMEALTFTKGGGHPAPFPHTFQLHLHQFVHAALKRKSREERGDTEFARDLLDDVREKCEKRREPAAPVPQSILDALRHELPAAAARRIVAYVCTGREQEGAYLKRKFAEIRKH